ncbi:MAG: autoinducer binding domain-containing protein [Pseudomonadota bacterium]
MTDSAIVLDVVRTIDRSSTADAAISTFMGFAGRYGFEHFYITQIVNPLRADAAGAMIHTDWPDEIIRPRMNGLELLRDPVVQYGMRSRFAFDWDEAYKHATRYGRAMMEETRVHRLKCGYSFPMRRPGAPIGGVSIGCERFEMSREEMPGLELAAMHVYARLERFHGQSFIDESKPLSEQEVDVLQYSALGKTAWEIAIVLGITESGVKKALHRAREKLNAVNTAQACACAISKDLILP